MKSHAIVNFGLYVTSEDLLGYAERMNEDADDLMFELGHYHSDADCECTSLITGDTFYAGESFTIFPLENRPTLFTQAYENKEAALVELKENFSKYLPADFNYEEMFVKCAGTVFG